MAALLASQKVNEVRDEIPIMSARRREWKSGFAMKQFHVHQDQCAMKVSSDACLFGALIQTYSTGFGLDLGTGTGLLALMVAQQSNAFIDAIDCDHGAVAQASANVAASPFTDRIQVKLADLRLFQPSRTYDFMFCNPPFFNGHLPTRGGPARILARHEESMSLELLCDFGQKYLKAEGHLWLLLPAPRLEKIIPLVLQASMQPLAVTWLLDHPEAHPHRFILKTGKPRKLLATDAGESLAQASVALFKSASDRSLTPQAKQLLAPFYLRC